MKNQIDISVILLSYNSEWLKLRLSLESILLQENVLMEIIVADDGSKKKWDTEIKQICRKYNFSNIIFSNQKRNVGTCQNLFDAIKLATGQYIKALSPGDLFFDKNSAAKWISYMKTERCRVSFGQAAYYNIEDNTINVIQAKASPNNPDIYIDNAKARKKIFVDCLLANDTILGASIMMQTDVMYNYLKRMIGKIKYAEDFMLRIMIFEGERVCYYQSLAIWYEYGLGISTSKNSKWSKILYKDFVASNKIIEKSKIHRDYLAQKYIKYLKRCNKNYSLKKVWKIIFFPSVCYWRIRSKMFGKLTTDEVNKTFLLNINKKIEAE